MNFDLNEVALASGLIYSTLERLNQMGIVDVDLENVNLGSSALAALEKDFLDENLPEDENTDEGLFRKGVRFVLSAIYYDGTPVIGEADDGPMSVGYTKDGS